MSTKEAITRAEPIRPFCLAFADAKTEVFDCINATMKKHGIPPYLMESILTEAMHQARAVANNEIQRARETYQRQMEEFHKSTE